MNLISYFAALVISFLGLFFGLSLAYIAPEELKPGEKYLKFLQKIILSSIIALHIYFFNLHIIVSLIFVAIIVILIFKFFQKISSNVLYFALGLLFFLASKDGKLFLLNALLIFFFGFPSRGYGCFHRLTLLH